MGYNISGHFRIFQTFGFTLASLWLHGFASKALLLQNKNDLKLVETTNGTRKIISSPKIITLMGKEAIMETFEDEKSKKAVMTLKILPTRI